MFSFHSLVILEVGDSYAIVKSELINITRVWDKEKIGSHAAFFLGGMSRNAPSKETAAHNRTTFLPFCVCGLFALC